MDFILFLGSGKILVSMIFKGRMDPRARIGECKIIFWKAAFDSCLVPKRIVFASN